MRQKFVYALVSDAADYRAEQLGISAHTLKKHNPEAWVIVLADKETAASLHGERGRIRDYADEIVEVNVPPELDNTQRSRYLKLKSRELVAGDIVYLDNDTLILGSLDCLKNVDAEMAAVLDEHYSGSNHLQITEYLRRTGKQYWGGDNYFNGGVWLARDTPAVHAFFADWFNLWNEERRKFGLSIDQPAFAQTNMRHRLIEELDGKLNCQLLVPGAARYFMSALILHYFAFQDCRSSFPLVQQEVLEDFRRNGFTASIVKVIENPIGEYLANSLVIGGREKEIYQMPASVLGRKLARTFPFFNTIATIVYRLFGKKL